MKNLSSILHRENTELRGVMGAANQIEHRWSQRRFVSLQVEIVGAGVNEDCTTKDVGLGGAFVEMSGHIPDCDTDVELLFSLSNHDQRVTKHRLSARVVRSANNGVGLVFKDFDTRAFRSLQEVMRHAPAKNYRYN